MDEDPSNNLLENLLPLCPNHHLTDQHDPTRRIDLPKLKLFRKYKDPAILLPEFHPLYRRLEFLNKLVVDESQIRDIEAAGIELVDFVSALAMGSFYAERLRKLTKRPPSGLVKRMDRRPDPEYERQRDAYHREYRQQLMDAREEITELVVELLRYQPWANRSA